jgi:mono/diheme cytochrome c family protein
METIHITDHPKNQTMHIGKLILVLLLNVVCTLNVAAQTTIPEDAKKETAPFVFNQETVQRGEQVYQLNCKSCHGDPGKANYANLDPIPKDPASPDYQKNSDGEMHYIITHGKGLLMPTFANTLNDEDRWSVIAYVRSFNTDYQQPPVQLTGKTVETETARLILAYNTSLQKLYAQITDSTKGMSIPLANVKVKLFVKRTFGNLPVANSTTNEQGIAYFEIPSDIPGNPEGFITLIAQTEGNSKQLVTSLEEKLGVATTPKLILDDRSWWNIGKMAPIWLIVLYTTGLASVAAVILYVLMQLRKIKIINHNKNN